MEEEIDITFEDTDGICPYCLNDHRDGEGYTVKWHYDNHLKVCKVRLAEEEIIEDSIDDVIEEVISESDPEPEVVVVVVDDEKVEDVIMETPNGYRVLVCINENNDHWKPRYEGGNIEMALRVKSDYERSGKRVKMEDY